MIMGEIALQLIILPETFQLTLNILYHGPGRAHYVCWHCRVSDYTVEVLSISKASLSWHTASQCGPPAKAHGAAGEGGEPLYGEGGAVGDTA